MSNNIKKASWQFIFLFGIISMFGDITYEGGRSIASPYLAVLGASAAAVGLVSGLGEFVGYAFRLLSGYVAAKTKSYWVITFIGYGLLVFIPLLALANNWKLAAFFVVMERFGKAVRSPAKDTMLSFATSNTGRGFGFAVHEFIDQIGGIIGPLLFSAVFFLHGTYKQGFTLLWISAILTLVFLLTARIKVPNPESLEEYHSEEQNTPSPAQKLSAKFWWYILFSFLSVLGFANFQLIAYHLKVNTIITDVQIPFFYAIAMGVDAIAALLVGKIYDKSGLKVLILLPLLSVPIAFLAFTYSFNLVLTGTVLWGIVMAIHETIMRAAIADMVSGNKRAFAYGIFNTAYGLAWFLGSVAIGFLYEINIGSILWFISCVQVLSVLSFLFLNKQLKKS
ncbi:MULTISPECIES: MFS transporter [Chitinophagaceae]